MSRATRPISHYVGPPLGPSVGRSVASVPLLIFGLFTAPAQPHATWLWCIRPFSEVELISGRLAFPFAFPRGPKDDSQDRAATGVSERPNLWRLFQNCWKDSRDFSHPDLHRGGVRPSEVKKLKAAWRAVIKTGMPRQLPYFDRLYTLETED